MALRLKELYPRRRFTFFITPTGDELPEMEAHWDKLERMLGQELTVISGCTLNELIEVQDALPNWRQRWCTRIIKIEPCIELVRDLLHRGDRVILYVGLRADEESRKGGLYGDDAEVVYPLREWGWGLEEVVDYLDHRGVEIPARTDCARCYEQRIGEWYYLWLDHPDIFEEAAQQEENTGHTFRSKGPAVKAKKVTKEAIESGEAADLVILKKASGRDIWSVSSYEGRLPAAFVEKFSEAKKTARGYVRKILAMGDGEDVVDLVIRKGRQKQYLRYHIRKTPFGHWHSGKDTWPASLRELEVEFKGGRRPRGISGDCGPRVGGCRVCAM